MMTIIDTIEIPEEALNFTIPDGEYEGFWHSDHIELTMHITYRDTRVATLPLHLSSEKFPRKRTKSPLQANITVSEGMIRCIAILPHQDQCRTDEGV